jgi:hypothetical protein
MAEGRPATFYEISIVTKNVEAGIAQLHSAGLRAG